jgi:glycosyltransferase involved in cell wall biosynthesis
LRLMSSAVETADRTLGAGHPQEPGADPPGCVTVSIVLPTFNRAAMLDGAIRSCLAQSFRQLELIVVDDGSTDDTPSVVSSWMERDSRVRYVRQKNGKIPRALNAGFAVATGDLLTWTSDDNLYEPDALEIMVNYLETHSDVGLVYCDMLAIDEDGDPIAIHPASDPSTIYQKNCVGACFLYRRSVAERVGEYDPQAFLAEDYDYWLRISQVVPIAHLAGMSPYRYRDHANALGALRGAEAELQAARIRAKHARTALERRRILSAGERAAADELRVWGRFASAARHYLRSISLNPLQAAAYRGLAAACLRHRLRTIVDLPR